MKETDKKTITKFIINVLGFMKVLLGIFLVLIVTVILSHVFEIEQLISLFDNGIYDTLQKMSLVFYSPKFSEENTASALVYLALAVICLLLLFESISDSIEDIIRMFEKSKEEAIAIDNKNVNKQIQKNYEKHLKTSIQFVLILKLYYEKKSTSQAFQDAELERENNETNKRLLAELRTAIVKNVNCRCSVTQDLILMQISSAEILNRILFYIKSICQVPKYTSRGLTFNIAVTTFSVDSPIDTAISEAKKIIDLQIKNKIVCYQIVDECLNFVPTNNFKAVNIGEYYDVNDSLFELVNKY